MLQVGKRDVLVYIQTFNLMEEAMGACRDGFVSVNASRTNHTDGRFGCFHDTALDRTGVGAEDNVGVLFNEESVLHVACRMIFREVHGRKHVPVIFDFWSVCKRKSQAGEDVNDFAFHD